MRPVSFRPGLRGRANILISRVLGGEMTPSARAGAGRRSEKYRFFRMGFSIW
jgi:hypothetical protein